MPRTMMHVNNIFWLGGVPMFIKDLIAAYPEFHHVVGYLWWNSGFAPHPDFDMIQEWEHVYGCRVGYIGRLTPEPIEATNPSILMLHNTPYKLIDKVDESWSWLGRWPSINFHHMRSDILREATRHVCISKDVVTRFTKNEQQLFGPTGYTICPPAINADGFKNIARPQPRNHVVVGKVCSDWNVLKYPQQLLRVMRAVADKHAGTHFSVIGGEKHWSQPTFFKNGKYLPIKEEIPVPNLVMPPALSKPVHDMLADLDIFLYINEPTLPESWCRAVTEAMAAGLPVVAERRGGIVEQIEHGVDGFLCETDAEFIECVTALVEQPELRKQVGERARHKALTQFGLSRIRKELDPLILRCLTTAI